jgi:hypothetical protein
MSLPDASVESALQSFRIGVWIDGTKGEAGVTISK